MKITRLYTDDKGETHFEDVEVAFGERSDSGRYAEPIPVKNLIFREVHANYDLDWHNAPRRQYIVNLDAGVQITVSDGEVRQIGQGEVFLVEDTTGQGHLSKAIANQVRRCLFITLD